MGFNHSTVHRNFIASLIVMDLRGVIPWETVCWSSEELPYSASSLDSVTSATALRRVLLASNGDHSDQGWRSEKFCAYPQELVFCVATSSRSSPTVPPIHSLVVVSHATMIPTRIEIFVSTTPTVSPTQTQTQTQWRQAPPVFHRLGYIALASPHETQCVAQELKTVPFSQQSAVQSTGDEITYVRLLVHSCHIHTANPFSQVALACVVALSEAPDHDAVAQCEQSIPSLATALHHRLHPGSDQVSDSESLTLGRPWSVSKSPLKAVNSSVSSSAYSPHKMAAEPAILWSAAQGEFVTATQILTRIQLARQRHAVRKSAVQAGKDEYDEQSHAWCVDELACQQLIDQWRHLQAFEVTARTVDDRLALRTRMDAVLHSLRSLDTRVRERETVMQRSASYAMATQLAHSPIKAPAKSPAKSPVKSSPSKLVSFSFLPVQWMKLDQWQAREDYVWEVVAAIKHRMDTEDRRRRSDTHSLGGEYEELLDEGLQIAKMALRDAHAQVFIAASALLQIVLSNHPQFHDGSAWKQEVVALLQLQVNRLDDLQPMVRNNAAFSIIKIAELTRARGSFVLHHLLQMSESQQLPQSDQTLYGVLKVMIALLQTFHCCATIDVAPTRVLKLIVTSDALIHDNGHVREAARELLVVLHGQVAGDVVLQYFRKKKLPVDAVRAIEELFAVLAHKHHEHAQEFH